MITKRIIPCLDVMNGRIVKGIKFEKHIDAGSPVELAKKYYKEGADELVFYDITASSDRRKILIDLVKHVAEQIFIPFTVGGGVRTLADIRNLLLVGADKVSINTAALENPDLINEASRVFGSQCIVIGIDTMKINGIDMVFSYAGRKETRKNTGRKTIDWAKEVEKRGAGEIILNSIDADGTQKGYDIEITKRISETVNIPCVASGGAGKAEDILKVLYEGEADAVIAASIFHFNILPIKKLKNYLSKNNVAIRL